MTKPKLNKVCCNPFSDHKTVNKKLRLINPTLVKQAKQLRVKLNVNKYICNKCRLKIVQPTVASSSKSKECQKGDEIEDEKDESGEEKSGSESGIEKQIQMEISQTKHEKVCCNPFSLHGGNRKKMFVK